MKGTGGAREMTMEGGGGEQKMKKPIRRVRGRGSTRTVQERKRVAYIERGASARPRQP